MTILGDDQQLLDVGRRARRSAPRAMALAALPTANTATGAGARRRADARSTHCAAIDRAQRGVEQFEQDAARVHGIGLHTPARDSDLDDLETGRVAVAARGLGRIRAFGLAGARGIRA